MKWFVFSDVHSFYEPLMTALTDAGFDANNPNHGIISCGDLLDRGPDTIKVLDFVLSLPPERTILVRGNHEFLLDQILSKQRAPMQHDWSNGTLNTMAHLGGFDSIADFWLSKDSSDDTLIKKVNNNKLLKEYKKRLRNYAIINSNIFVHGYAPCARFEDIKNMSTEDWYKLSWANGHSYALMGEFIKDKVIYFGHFHNSWARTKMDGGDEWGDNVRFNTITYVDDAGDVFAVGLDACTVHTMMVNVAVVDE